MVLFFLSIGYYTVQAQTENRWSLALNMGRYAKVVGMFDADQYVNKVSLITGFNIGYQHSKRVIFFVGFRNVGSSVCLGTRNSYRRLAKWRY